MRLWLLLPAACLYTLDVALTLQGQPATYWEGDYGTATEFNPVAHPLLATHPATFAGAALAWLAVFAALVLFWRHPLAAWLAVALAVGHAIGGSTWLARHGSAGWLFALGYLSAAAFLSRRCWRRAVAGGEAGAN